jgi:hypothetical protein
LPETGLMTRYSDRITQPLTLKYVFALGLLAVLALTNFLLLRKEILSSQAMASILNNSGHQRMLLHRTAMLAERLVFASDATSRNQLRHELASATDPLEKTHFELMLPDSEDTSPPEELRAIYEDVPFLLDLEMRNTSCTCKRSPKPTTTSCATETYISSTFEILTPSIRSSRG